LLKVIRRAVPAYPLQIISSIEEFTERLRQPLADVSVAVLYAATRSELMDIVFLADFLTELRIVLVLPDSEPESLRRAHILRPRFIATSQNDFRNLDMVLKRMMELYDKPH